MINKDATSLANGLEASTTRHVKMAAKYLITLLALLTIAESRKSYTITGTWNNEIKKCASGGGDQHDYFYDLSELDKIGLNYEEIDELTTVIAHFETMNGHTKAVSDADIKFLLLNEYKQGTNFKQFYGTWKYTAVCGWGTQATKLSLIIKFYEDGKVKLENYVYAGSWGAVSCAETKSHIGKIQIIN